MPVLLYSYLYSEILMLRLPFKLSKTGKKTCQRDIGLRKGEEG